MKRKTVTPYAPRCAKRKPVETAGVSFLRKNTVSPAKQHGSDTIATAAHIAQIFLVAVVVFGYFYTVMPIYRKQLLADRVNRQQEILAGLEARNLKLLEQIKENSETLDEQYGAIAKSKEHMAAVRKEMQNISQETAAVLAESAKTLWDKMEIETEIAYLRDEAALGRKTLLTLETNLAREYKEIFYESMEEHAVAQFFALHKNRRSEQRAKRAVDIISDYKERTLPVASLIEKSLNAYDQKLSKSYAMIPPAVRKKLADESRTTLAKRDDLKEVPFDTTKVVALLNERDNKIFALPPNLPQPERIKRIMQIGREYNKKLTGLIAEFKHEYIKEVKDFFEG